MCLFLCGCGFTVTITPTQKKKPALQASHVHHQKHKKQQQSATIVVDSNWMSEYHRLESRHGEYKLPDDGKIETLSNGKFRVPRSLIKHFQDLSQTPEVTPTP